MTKWELVLLRVFGVLKNVAISDSKFKVVKQILTKFGNLKQLKIILRLIETNRLAIKRTIRQKTKRFSKN